MAFGLSFGPPLEHLIHDRMPENHDERDESVEELPQVLQQEVVRKQQQAPRTRQERGLSPCRNLEREDNGASEDDTRACGRS